MPKKVFKIAGILLNLLNSTRSTNILSSEHTSSSITYLLSPTQTLFVITGSIDILDQNAYQTQRPGVGPNDRRIHLRKSTLVSSWRSSILMSLQYLNNKIFLNYYKAIKKAGSTESDLAYFWNNLLPLIFKLSDGWAVEPESNPLKGNGQKSDFSLRYVKNGDYRLVIVENKRHELAGQSAVWADGLEQATRYAKLTRTNDSQNKGLTMHILVNVGTYTRFYQLDPYKQSTIDWAPTGGRYLEMADDEAEMWTHLHEIKNLVETSARAMS